MDLRKIKKLIKLLQESQITEIEVRHGDETIRVCQAREQQPAPVPVPKEQDTPAEQAETPPVAANDGQSVKSPMVGVFYAAPEPGAEPFVRPGQRVRRGDVLCIIEAMKIMNPLEAEQQGVVREIMISDGDPVEYGQTLLVLDPL